jgi:hypothetical protein
MRPLAAALLLAVWLGGATLVATTVAPAAFAVLPTRALAGALVGRVLPVVFWSGMLVGFVAAVLAWRDGATARVVASLGTLAACAVAQLVIGPRIARLREAIGPSIEALATTDPQRLAFGRLHGISVLCMGVGMIAAAVAIVLVVLGTRARG